jgi:serralysin
MPTQTTNSIQTSLPGLAFTADWQTWTIAGGVIVSSSGNNAVYSQFNGSSLFNNGNIGSVSSGWDGVRFDGNQGHITNALGASIKGHYDAIGLYGDDAIVDNFGSIVGGAYTGVFLAASSNHVTVNNSGDIHGFYWGIAAWSTLEGGHIGNSGLISGGFYGIDVSTAAGLTTFIKNAGTGTINGAVAISTEAGAIALDNQGTLAGGISCTAAGANDTIVNSGKITGSVLLGPGDDSFAGADGTSGVSIFGEAGKDNLLGGKGDDLISGGRSSDTLTGGPGSDHFRFDAALSAVANVDAIDDFAHGIDRIELSHQIFAATNASGALTASMFFNGTGAHDASDRIIYDPASGFLTYDSNGNAAGGAVHFATLSPHLAMTNIDFLVVA